MNRMFIAACFVVSTVTGCMHGGMYSEAGDREDRPGMMMGRKAQRWPAVRIDEPEGARVTMEPGLFGDGLDAVTPFQGQFQTTGTLSMTGYPLEIHLDEALARRYGGDKATTLYARLTVAANDRLEAVRIAPSDCELRALLAGEVDEIRTVAEQLPSVAERCAAEHAVPGHANPGPMCGAAPDAERGGCSPGGHGGCPHMTHGGCPHMTHGGCRHHGQPGPWGRAATVMKIRLAKF